MLKLPKRRLETVSLGEIDLEYARFDFGRHRPVSELAESVRRLGLVHPPTLREGAGGHQIVAGHRRLKALAKQQAADVKAFVIPESTSDRECMELALAEKLARRELDPLERAGFLKVLTTVCSRDEVLKIFCPLLGVAPNDEGIARACSFLDLVPDLQRELAAERLAEKPAAVLSLTSAEDQNNFSRILTAGRLGINLQREFLDLLREISQRDGEPVSDILGRAEVGEIIDDAELSAPQKADAIRKYLRRLRHPVFSRYERVSDEAAAELRWPPGIKVSHHPYFENRQLRVELTFESAEELKAHIERLQALSDSEELQSRLRGGECGPDEAAAEED